MIFGVVRFSAHRLLVMKDGQIVESGLTDRVLDGGAVAKGTLSLWQPRRPLGLAESDNEWEVN